MKTYKAFDKNLKCRNFQYTIGNTYTIDSHIIPCQNGFHSCENPLDVFKYYPLDSRFAEVAPSGTILKEQDKTCSSAITIIKEIDIGTLIDESVQWCLNNIKDAKNIASGNYSTAASSGYYSKAASSGDSSTAASSGYNSKAASSGDNSKAASSGNYSTAVSSGNYSTAASSGNYSTTASSGTSSTAASSGYYSKAASSGYNSTAASSGDYSKAASSGDSSTAASSGYNSTAASSGEKTIAAGIGKNCRVKGSIGSLLVLIYYDNNNKPNKAISGLVENDGNLKPDTWYKLDNSGNFIEA